MLIPLTLPTSSWIPLQFCMLPTDMLKPLFNAICYEQLVPGVGLKLSLLHTVLHFTYPHQNVVSSYRIDTEHSKDDSLWCTMYCITYVYASYYCLIIGSRGNTNLCNFRTFLSLLTLLLLYLYVYRRILCVLPYYCCTLMPWLRVFLISSDGCQMHTYSPFSVIILFTWCCVT